MLLSILIPTLNRSNALIKNIKMLDEYICNNNLADEIEIIVSDNGSELKDIQIIKEYIPNVKCRCLFYYQDHNIGFENNLLFLLDNCHSKYALTLGDDDYLNLDLFESIVEYLKTGEYKAIICNFFLIDEFENKISDTRDPVTDDLVVQQNCLEISSRAHQMSCLAFCTEGLLQAYKSNCKSTLYPQIFFVGYNLSLGKGVHITRFPYKCTLLNKKNFDYGFDNLLGEICVAYDCLPFSSLDEKKKTLLVLLKYEHDRFINRQVFFRPLRFIYRVIFKYNISVLFKRLIIRFYIIESFKLPFKYLHDKFVRR